MERNSPFKLKTELKPSGDRPEAIKKLLQNLQRGIKEEILLGATGTGKSLQPLSQGYLCFRNPRRLENGEGLQN